MSLAGILRGLAASMPRGSRFDFSMEGDALHLDYLRCAKPGRGYGTRFLCSVLAAADCYGVACSLHADPSDLPDEPDTFELVRWYRRFGFDLVGLNDDEWVVMERPRGERDATSGSIRLAFERARLVDIVRCEFEQWRENAPRAARIP